MNQKQIGSVLILLAILAGILTYHVKSQQDEVIHMQVVQTGTCMLDDGTCLHADQEWTMVVIGVLIVASLSMLGVYLIFFDKTQQRILEANEQVSTALRDAKLAEKSKDEFQAFLKGFASDEQAVLKAINDQEGILQSTLRYRSGIGKAKLSLMLADLEERGFISRSVKGKSKQVFLRNR